MAGGLWTVYSNAILEACKKLIDLGTDTYVLALVSGAYTPSPNSHALWSSVSANELATAGGYTAGGVVLTGQSATLTAATVKFDANDPSWASFSAGPFRYGVIVRRAGGALAPSDLLLCYCDLTGSNITGTGNTFSINFDAAGIFLVVSNYVPVALTPGGVPIPAGWTLVRTDTFGTFGSIPNLSALHTYYKEGMYFNSDENGHVSPNPINSQQQTYTNFEAGSVVFSTDHLTIQARGSAGPVITSAQMSSRFSERSVIFEARFKAPATPGSWAEFWAFPVVSSTPISAGVFDRSELDVEVPICSPGSAQTAETIHNVSLGNFDSSATLPSVVTIYDSHFVAAPTYWFYTNPAFDVSSAPHYYTIVYDDTGPGTVKRYIDGVLIYSATMKWMGALGGTGFGADMNATIDLAAGGGFPGILTSGDAAAYTGDLDIYSMSFYSTRVIPITQAWDQSHKSGSVFLSPDSMTATAKSFSFSGIAGQNQTAFAIKTGSGRYYWEVVLTGGANVGAGVGVSGSAPTAVTNGGAYLGFQSNSIGWFPNGGVLNANGTLTSWETYSAVSGVRLCFALDKVSNKIWGRVGTTGNWNNAAIGSQNPAVGSQVGGTALPAASQTNTVPGVALYAVDETAVGNFAAFTWLGTPPTGFGEW